MAGLFPYEGAISRLKKSVYVHASSYFPLLDSNRFPLVVLSLDNKNFLPGDGHSINVVFKHHCEENHRIAEEYLLNEGWKQSTVSLTTR